MSTDGSRWSQRKHLRYRRLERNPPPISRQSTQKSHNSGSWIKSKILPLFSSWFQPHRPYNPDESFFPFPKITFLVDRPTDLLCQICRDAHCEIKPDGDNLGDSTFSMLPFSLSYPGCGHKIPPRAVTQESVHLLPRTLPDKGHIPQLCAKCLKEDLLTQAKARFEVAVYEFREARRRFHQTRHQKEEEKMLLRREDFETILRDDVYLPQLNMWLTSCLLKGTVVEWPAGRGRQHPLTAGNCRFSSLQPPGSIHGKMGPVTQDVQEPWGMDSWIAAPAAPWLLPDQSVTGGLPFCRCSPPPSRFVASASAVQTPPLASSPLHGITTSTTGRPTDRPTGFAAAWMSSYSGLRESGPREPGPGESGTSTPVSVSPGFCLSV
ncbi:hypothetical protein G7046_g7254 [Stylonectria norvegica]|nr:hypothetical protein G7046_g7254 [Stylonectria norvegica]